MSHKCKSQLGTSKVLSDQCLAENRYPRDVAREYIVLHPHEGICFTVSELVSGIDEVMTEESCND